MEWQIKLENILAMQQEPALDFVLPGLLKGTVGAIVSPGGVGKSWLALQLCLSIATEIDILGIGKQKRGAVWYFNAEDPQEIMKWRLYHILQKYKNDERIINAIHENTFNVGALLGFTPRLLNEKGLQDKRCKEWADFIKSCVMSTQVECRLIIIDTLRKFHGAVENDSGAMTNLTQLLDSIAKETGASVVFLHHANKLAQSTNNSDEAGASRGSSCLVDNIRWQWNLVTMGKNAVKDYDVDEKDRKKYLQVNGAKVNYGADTDDLWLKRSDKGVLEPTTLTKKEKGENSNGKRKDR